VAKEFEAGIKADSRPLCFRVSSGGLVDPTGMVALSGRFPGSERRLADPSHDFDRFAAMAASIRKIEPSQ
jgi:hypothetical protein